VTGQSVVLMTAPDAATAERIARALVEERLIACANLLPGVTSVYRWEGRVQAEAEVLVVMKTREALLPALFERAAALHPYQVPELVAAPVAAGLAAYCRWVDEETGGGETGMEGDAVPRFSQSV
jgi:periplasmic divalent cation tolerance protein